jgi:hypothetical protein
MTDEATPITDPERRVVEAAKLYVYARQSFIRMRTSMRHSGIEVARARVRCDETVRLLEAAVEELPST